MSTPKTTNDAWEELCQAADAARTAPVAAAVVAPTVHPFEKSMGAGPYRFKGAHKGQSSCAHCGKRIANIYMVANAADQSFPVGSECILKLGNGFSAHLVANVRVAKKRFDREQREARKKRKRDEGVETMRSLYPKEMEFLDNYRGNFELFISFKNQLVCKGSLSEKQVAVITRSLERQSQPRPQRTFSLKVGTTLILTKFFAHKIGEATGLTRPHFAVEVLEVMAESEKAYNVKLKLSAQRTSHCAICGLGLTNPESVHAGIGPICAEKVGVSFSGAALEELAEKLRTVQATATLWIPKSQIKERKEPV